MSEDKEDLILVLVIIYLVHTNALGHSLWWLLLILML